MTSASARLAAPAARAALPAAGGPAPRAAPPVTPPGAPPSRRLALAALALPPAALVLAASHATAAPAAAAASAAAAPRIGVEADSPGAGTAAARRGDLVLVHYVGTLAEGGAVFDSTRGGLAYRDGGPGALQPTAIRLGGDPAPGLVAGLAAAIEGMRVGGRRRVRVPAALGFGSGAPVLAPYALVPPGSALVYEVELLRLSRRGPDALMTGVARCGRGGQAASAEQCANIAPAEFL
jgi:FKBP-type peptidyl-prolyl cis-trans isomerase FkpA